MHSEGAMFYTPTRRERLLRWFGFNRPCAPELPDDVVARLPGWAVTIVNVRLDALDRLRVLVTGRLHIRAVHASDREPGEMVTAAAVSIRWGDEETI